MMRAQQWTHFDHYTADQTLVVGMGYENENQPPCFDLVCNSLKSSGEGMRILVSIRDLVAVKLRKSPEYRGPPEDTIF